MTQRTRRTRPAAEPAAARMARLNLQEYVNKLSAQLRDTQGQLERLQGQQIRQAQQFRCLRAVCNELQQDLLARAVSVRTVLDSLPKEL